MIVLWTAAAYLKQQGRLHWIATLPALFMTVVVTSFLGYAKIGFSLPMPVATGLGLVVALICAILFFLKIKPQVSQGS